MTLGHCEGPGILLVAAVCCYPSCIGTCREVCRARFGPGLGPGPRRQARWAGRGLQGQRRTAGASRAAGCEAPLRLEGPARTMRGVPRRGCDIFPAIGVSGERDRPGRGLGGRGSGIRRGPQAAGHRGAVRGSRRAVGLASEGRGGSCRPATARSPGEPRPPTAGHPGRSFLSTARARPGCSRPGPSGPARRRCALEAVEKVVTAQSDHSRT